MWVLCRQFGFAVHRRPSPAPVSLKPAVRNQLLQTVALCWKRGWATDTPEERQALLQKLAQMLGLVPIPGVEPSVQRQLVGIKLCVRLVQEFDANRKSTAMGLSFEFHRTARDGFQAVGLMPVFQIASGALLRLVKTIQTSVAGKPVQLGTGSADGLLDPRLRDLTIGCLSVMEEVLGWEFKRRRPRWEGVVKPGKTWAPVLTPPSLSDGLFALYQSVR